MLLSAVAAEPIVSLAALPFGNLSDYRGRLMDRRAAAAVSTEAPAPWAPLDPPRVLQALEDLNVPWPLETADVQRLCGQLQAAAAATGAIQKVEVQPQGAEVTIILEVLEPFSGEVIGYAQAMGKFNTRDPLAVDERVEQALCRAARAAWTALGPPPTVVGQTAAAVIGERLPVRLAVKARVAPKAVLLFYPPEGDPAAAPLAAAVVKTIAAGTAQARLVGKREEVSVGAVAVMIGRLP